MQRKLIKVGFAYAVRNSRPRRSGRRDRAVPVRATVIELNAEYPTRRTYSGKANDGIRVRFDEPVVRMMDDYTPVSVLRTRNLSREAVERYEEAAITEDVIRDPQYIVSLWADHAREQEESERWEDYHRRRADAQRVAFKPMFEATIKALRERGLKPKVYADLSGIATEDVDISLERQTGTSGKQVVTGFAHKDARVSIEFLLGVLGVEGDPHPEVEVEKPQEAVA